MVGKQINTPRIMNTTPITRKYGNKSRDCVFDNSDVAKETTTQNTPITAKAHDAMASKTQAGVFMSRPTGGGVL